MDHIWLAIQLLRIALEVVQLTLDVGILDLQVLQVLPTENTTFSPKAIYKNYNSIYH